jgi:sugar lactone lactonase YvrE
MRQAWRALAGVLAIGVLGAGGSAALADGGGHGGHNGNGNGNRGNALATTIFTMPAADGPPEGVAFDKRSGRFFVSRTGTGAIFAGTLDSPTLTPFIAGGAASPNPVATGLKVRRGLLYVAGASTGQIRVYNLANPTAAPIVFETGGGFINDLDLDRHGNVFATDSTKSTIFEVTAEQVAAGTGTPTAIDVSSGITSDTTPGVFNLNGIVVRGHDELIVVQSNVGKLFRITFGNRHDDHHGDHARKAQATTPATPTVQEIAIQGGDGNVNGGDGLLIDRGRLLVGRGSTPHNANGAVQAFKLRRGDTQARFESETSDPSLQGPSTLARARNRILVVNPNFAGAATATQFTVTGLARNAIRHGGGGGGRHGH